MFAETRMSFGDHLEDLRIHLWRALAGFLVGLLLGFFVAPKVLDIINAPVEQQLMQFYRNRVDKYRKQLEDGDSSAVALNQPQDSRIQVNKKALFAALGIPDPNPEEEWMELPVRIYPLDIT